MTAVGRSGDIVELKASIPATVQAGHYHPEEYGLVILRDVFQTGHLVIKYFD